MAAVRDSWCISMGSPYFEDFLEPLIAWALSMVRALVSSPDFRKAQTDVHVGMRLVHLSRSRIVANDDFGVQLGNHCTCAMGTWTAYIHAYIHTYIHTYIHRYSEFTIIMLLFIIGARSGLPQIMMPYI